MNTKIDVIYERQWRPMPYPVRALERLGLMNHFYGGFPKFRYTNGGINSQIIRTQPSATLWNHLILKSHLPTCLRLSEPKSLARFVLKQRDLAPAVWSNGTVHRFLFSTLKEKGHITILERGSMYPYEHFHFQQRAREEAGVSFSKATPDSIQHEMEQTKYADAILACSSMVRKSYLDRGYSPDLVHECDFGIDTSDYPYIQREPASGRAIRIGIIGMIGFRKGIWRIIKIAEWAKKAKLNVEFHFAGPIEDPEAGTMIQNSSGNYHLHGVLKGAELRNLIRMCDIYCLPSYEEGLPFSVLEAMSSGLPAIVSTDTGACEAAEDGVSGIHLTQFTNDEFDNKLGSILSEPESILTMGKNARKKIEHKYTIEHYYARIESALSKVFSKS